MEANRLSVKEEVALIRNRIKSECKTISVTMAKGTSYGWVNIGGSGDYSGFTPAEIAALGRLGITKPGGNFADLNGSERSDWAKRLQVSPKANYARIDEGWYD